MNKKAKGTMMKVIGIVLILETVIIIILLNQIRGTQEPKEGQVNSLLTLQDQIFQQEEERLDLTGSVINNNNSLKSQEENSVVEKNTDNSHSKSNNKQENQSEMISDLIQDESTSKGAESLETADEEDKDDKNWGEEDWFY